MRVPEIYTSQDRFTDPGELAPLYGDLPRDPARLRELVSQWIAHVSWTARYGIPPDAPMPRETQPVAERLRLIRASFQGSLCRPRPPEKRSFGTCRDFALMLCSVLRHQSIAARVRCGFATYFTGGPFEDHWICEYWSSLDERWVRSDAQLDDLHRSKLDIQFDSADLPDSAFLTAGHAWRLIRSGVAAPEAFGHGDARGLWFARVNVYRDLLALTSRYTSAWDTWRDSTPACNALDSAAAAVVDSLATAIHDFEGGADKLAVLEDVAATSGVPPWHH
jgi:hypothetical protein